MEVWMPFCGEFGNKLLWHVPISRGFDGERIICHEEGEEALYPNTRYRYIIPRVNDDGRIDSGHVNDEAIYANIRSIFKNTSYIYPKEIKYASDKYKYKYFVPIGETYNFDTDVVIFPRTRKLGAERNWLYWVDLVSRLTAHGVRVFAGGQRDSSFAVECNAAWEYKNPLEASIWAIKNSKVRIGSVTGTTWLSLLCGKDVNLIVPKLGWFTHLIELYERVDHLKVGWRLIQSWNGVQDVLPVILSLLSSPDQPIISPLLMHFSTASPHGEIKQTSI